MAFRRVLVDRARRVSREPASAKVEGRTRYVPVYGPWFRARLTEAASPETLGLTQGQTRVANRSTLTFADHDAHGPIRLSASDKVEINSRQLGQQLWEVKGDPQPIRKLRKLLGFIATVEVVKEV